MFRTRALLLAVVALAPAAALVPTGARAQNLSTTLTVTGFPLSVAPTGGDFASGSVDTSPVSFEVEASAGPANASRTTILSIRCALPCPVTGTKPVSSLYWRRSDQGGWTQLTTGDAEVEQRAVVRNGMNNPWGNSLLFRFLLSWAGDPAGTTGSYEVVLTLTVTAP